MNKLEKGQNKKTLKAAIETLQEAVLEKLDEVTIKNNELPSPLFSTNNSKYSLRLQQSKVYFKKGKIQIEAEFKTPEQYVKTIMGPVLRDTNAKRKKFSGEIIIECKVKLTEAKKN